MAMRNIQYDRETLLLLQMLHNTMNRSVWRNLAPIRAWMCTLDEVIERMKHVTRNDTAT